MSPEIIANPQFSAAVLIGFGALLALFSIVIGYMVRGGSIALPSVPVLPPEPAPALPEPAPALPEPPLPVEPPSLIIKGKISTFGGPGDPDEGDPDEGLALYGEAQALGRPDLFLTIGDGLFRRLNPATYYIAARWDYKVTPKSWLRSHKVKLTANGKTIEVDPVDWGPHVDTGRALDISPGAAEALGLKTDDIATAKVPLPTAAVLPQDRPGGPSWLARAVALRGLYEKPGAADNPAILEMARIVGGNIAKTYTHDSIAWCALAMNYFLVASKYPGNDSLWALDFSSYGRKLTGPCVGAIASMKRDGGGHVAIVLGRTSAGGLVCIGGNMSDAIRDDVYPPERIVSYNYPEDAAMPLKVGVTMTDLSALPVVEPVPFVRKEVGL